MTNETRIADLEARAEELLAKAKDAMMSDDVASVEQHLADRRKALKEIETIRLAAQAGARQEATEAIQLALDGFLDEVPISSFSVSGTLRRTDTGFDDLTIRVTEFGNSWTDTFWKLFDESALDGLDSVTSVKFLLSPDSAPVVTLSGTGVRKSSGGGGNGGGKGRGWIHPEHGFRKLADACQLAFSEDDWKNVDAATTGGGVYSRKKSILSKYGWSLADPEDEATNEAS